MASRVIFGFFVCLITADGLHLEGRWAPYERYRFLTKFGFQRTQIDELEATRGYIYGTVKPEAANQTGSTAPRLGTLVLVDSEFILDLYGNATEPVWLDNFSYPSGELSAWLIENERCRRMFAKIDAIAWHRSCSPTGQMDLLRSVPCPLNGLCAEEDDPGRVIGNSQFTYTVQDLKQPRYWYLSLVACVRNPISCRWETTSVKKPGAASSVAKQSLVYSIWLVNGAPRLQGFNTFEHQFSFETHDTAEIFLTFLVLYLILSIVAHLKLSMLSAAHTCLFLISVWLFSLSALLATIHLAVFSFDGRGLGRVSEFATLVEQWGDALFLVLLLSTAEMGFVPPTSQNGASNSPYTNGFGADVKSKLKTLASSFHVGFYQRLAPGSPNPSSSNSDKLDPIPEQNRSWPYLLCMVTVFLSVKTFFYVWALLDQDPVIDFSVWNTVPGCILLAIRFGVAFWFLATLRRRKLLYDEYWDMESYGSLILGPGIDLVRFAALFLLWIFVLPLVVFVAETSVSTLWRNKTIISVCLSANYVAACAYAYMLWICRPSNRSDL